MPDDNITPPSNLSKLLDNARPELAAMDSGKVGPRKVLRNRVLQLTDILLPSFAALDKQLDVELHADRAATRRKQAAGLKTRAWVCFAADLQADEVSANTIKQRRDELATLVTGHDRTLFKWASPLFDSDPTHREILRDIQRGTGRRDDAEDVLRLAKLFRDNWAMAEGKTMITQELLDAAASDATALLDLLEPGKLSPARDLAMRAYSAWREDYNELVALGRYLSRANADADARFPGIHSAATGASGAAVVEEDGDAPNVDDAPNDDDAAVE